MYEDYIVAIKKNFVYVQSSYTRYEKVDIYEIQVILF